VQVLVVALALARGAPRVGVDAALVCGRDRQSKKMHGKSYK
jgi:hypothetical protein